MSSGGRRTQRPDNPCGRGGRDLGPQKSVGWHIRVLQHGEVASAIETVRASTARPVVKLALPVARSGEVHGGGMYGDRPACATPATGSPKKRRTRARVGRGRGQAPSAGRESVSLGRGAAPPASRVQNPVQKSH